MWFFIRFILSASLLLSAQISGASGFENSDTQLRQQDMNNRVRNIQAPGMCQTHIWHNVRSGCRHNRINAVITGETEAFQQLSGGSYGLKLLTLIVLLSGYRTFVQFSLRLQYLS